MISNELYDSVMTEYDYIEFLLSMVHYYYKAKNKEVIEVRRILEYKEHAVEILRLSKNTELGKKLREETIPITFDFSMVNDKIEQYYGITIEGNYFNVGIFIEARRVSD